MEWNGKPPLQWDWENLIMVNPMTENPKKLRATDWEIDGDRGIDSGSFNSSGVGSKSGSGGSGSDLGLASLSKSSKSASITSSSMEESKTSKFSLKAPEALTDSSSKKESMKAKPTSTCALEVSVGSSEPLLGLKLGKRTYFEDVCAGGTAKTSSFPAIPSSSVTPANIARKSKANFQTVNIPRCQVEGCNLDLSSAKDYHRKHRVCENHSKCPKVIVAGLERRFCQQCSRFHSLAEFDEKKRSCRRRLSDHNARRRKPQQESVQLNPARIPSSLYGTDERQQMTLVFNRTPLAHAGSNSDLTWDDASSPRFTITKEYPLKSAKVGVAMPGTEPANSMPMHHSNSNGFLPSKGKATTVEILNQSLDETIITSNVDATQDFHRALSLLSNNTWGSCEAKTVPLEQPMLKNQSSMPPSAQQMVPQGWPPLASSEYWRAEQQATDSRAHTSTSQNDGSSYFQEFQLLRVPYGNDFYSGQLN